MYTHACTRTTVSHCLQLFILAPYLYQWILSFISTYNWGYIAIAGVSKSNLTMLNSQRLQVKK